MESFVSSLKIKRVHRRVYNTKQEAKADPFGTRSASTIRAVGTRHSDT
jgi:hypothetical protein